MAGKKGPLPSELENVAYAQDVNALQEQVDKCYSTERYEDFQDAVKRIILETLDSGEGRTKVKGHAKESTKEYLDENSWKKLVFWAPTLISIISVAVAVWAVFYK